MSLYQQTTSKELCLDGFDRLPTFFGGDTDESDNNSITPGLRTEADKESLRGIIIAVSVCVGVIILCLLIISMYCCIIKSKNRNLDSLSQFSSKSQLEAESEVSKRSTKRRKSSKKQSSGEEDEAQNTASKLKVDFKNKPVSDDISPNVNPIAKGKTDATTKATDIN